MTGRPTATTTACTQCGEPIFAGDRYCGNCGASVTGGLAEATPPPTVDVNDTTPRPDGFTAFDGWERIIGRLRAATMGEFEIRRELGRGGMAIVFLAHEIALRRKVAIKLMSPGLLTNEEMVRKFREEAVMVAQMSHPNIITVHGVRNVEDLHFFIMKFVEGRPLDQVLHDAGQLSFAVARGLLHQVGSALGYAHRRGVIHRDVKPSNVLIDIDGDALVTDFGIAKAIDSESQTKTGSVVGTPTYMSPEQCYALPATWASDQYSLGVVAYEMIAGRAPFSGPSFAVMKAHVDEAVPPISGMRPDCPPQLEAAVMRMLAKKPEDRFPTIGQALSALGAAPLPEDDPQRLELAAIVRNALPTEPSLTPVSPLPASIKPTASAPRPPEPLPPSKPVTPQPASAPRVERQVSRPADLDPVVTAPMPVSEVRAPIIIEQVESATTVATPATPNVKSAPAPVVTPGRSNRRWLTGAALIGSAALAWFVITRGGPASRVADTGVSPPATDSVVAAAPPAAPPVSPPVAPPDSQPVRADSAARPDGRAPVPNAGGASTGAAEVEAVARSIAVTPPEITLMVGQTVRPEVTVRSTANQVLRGRRVVWSTPNAVVATVDRVTGAVTGVSEGSTEVVAISGDARATLRVRVEAPLVVAAVTVDQPRRLTVGDNVTLTAIVRDSRGGIMPDPTVTWASADTSVARVTPTTGIVTATAAGTSDISASAGGKSTTVRVVVVAPAPPPPRADPVTPPPDAAAEERRTRAAIESAVQQYVAALRAHDARRVASLYQSRSDDDRKNAQALARILENAAKLTAADARIDAPRVDGSNASVDFNIAMTWRNPFGLIKNQTVPFRADLTRDGTEWRLASVRALGVLIP